jgi:transcriptional regulator with XRE-family HTH domain
MSSMDISFTIKSLREAGLTQTQIGQAIGLKQTSISDMESGKAGTKRPSYQVISGLQRLAAEHNVATAPPTTSQPQ